MSLHVEQCGQGPELVLLHGWGSSSAIWDAIRDALAARFRLTLVDLPGLGRSRALPDTSLDAIVDALLPRVPARAIWLGWSLGGLVATRAAVRAPYRVSGLVTLASNPCFVQRDDWSCAMEPAVFDAFVDACREQPQRTLGRFTALQTQGSSNARAELKQLKAALAVAEIDDAGLQATLALLQQDGRATLAQVRQPSLHLLGAEDALVPPTLAPGLARLQPEAEVEVYPNAAHLPFLTESGRFIAQLVSFADWVAAQEQALAGGV